MRLIALALAIDPEPPQWCTRRTNYRSGGSPAVDLCQEKENSVGPPTVFPGQG